MIEGTYINLDSRPDRRELFEQRATAAGIKYRRLSAFTGEGIESSHPPAITGAHHSHRAIVEEAKEQKKPYVIGFEDDCVFSDDFSHWAERCLADVQKIKYWDMLYFGGEPGINCVRVSEALCECPDNGGIWQMHAYAVNERFYDQILRLNPDGAAIDVLVINTAQRRFFISYHLICWQDENSPSDGKPSGCTESLANVKANYDLRLRNARWDCLHLNIENGVCQDCRRWTQ